MAGFYGKLPAKGDFVSRGLPPAFTAAMDAWMQRGMQESRDALQDAWFDRYRVAPIWYYYLSRRVVDADAWLGVWIPSVDRVNRPFPLTVAVSCGITDVAFSELFAWTSWFQRCEDVLLDVLEEDVDFDGFCELADGLTAPEGATRGGESGGGEPKLPLLTNLYHTEGILGLPLGSVCEKPCAWISEGNDDIGYQLIVSSELPETGSFVGFLTGF